MKSTIQQQLEILALNRTDPFCYGCYIKAPLGVCPRCQSNDLMRIMDGVGCDWDLDFALKYILQEELTAVDIDAVFEEMIRSYYPEEITVGWMRFDACDLMKSQDPTAWRIARDEYIESLTEDEQIISFDNGSSYYRLHDLELLFLNPQKLNGHVSVR